MRNQPNSSQSLQNILFGRLFSHVHYLQTRRSIYGLPAKLPTTPSSVAQLSFSSFPDLRQYITIDPNPDTDTNVGKKVCQQIMMDLARFWIGEGVEYLALYVREW